MPRFKNTGLVPVQTPDGAPVAPGEFCTYDGEPVRGLVEVPEPATKAAAKKPSAKPAESQDGDR